MGRRQSSPLDRHSLRGPMGSRHSLCRPPRDQHPLCRPMGSRQCTISEILLVHIIFLRFQNKKVLFKKNKDGVKNIDYSIYIYIYIYIYIWKILSTPTYNYYHL